MNKPGPKSRQGGQKGEPKGEGSSGAGGQKTLQKGRAGVSGKGVVRTKRQRDNEKG